MPWRWRQRSHGARTAQRGITTHVIILDGTMSSLRANHETNVGKIYKLLLEAGRRTNLTLHYEAGIQWQDWRSTPSVMLGRGTNQQIKRAYGVLASRYRPGDRIFLIGYSRGAFAVRSLAGIIESVGLLSPNSATVRNIQTAYRHYRFGAKDETLKAFQSAFCHEHVSINAIGVFDTVKALGISFPVLWRLTHKEYAFHDTELGACVEHGFQALALNETRVAYAPEMWTTSENGTHKRVVQMWFRGNHADIGGQLKDYLPARPRTNIPLVWMLKQLQSVGLPLPHGWQHRFVKNVNAPSIGDWSAWGMLFWNRRRRIVGQDRSEFVHPTAQSDPLAHGLTTYKK